MEDIFFKYHHRARLSEAAKAGDHVYLNEYYRLKNLPVYRNPNIIKEIFRTYWDDFLLSLNDKMKPRESILTNVDRMIKCRDFSEGYIFFECPNCDEFYMIGLSCHSRFCPSCNKKYREQRAISVSRKLLDVNHRHFVFTIPEEFRYLFRLYRGLYDVLFISVNESFLKLLSSKISKRLDRRLGIVAFLHTFGRALNLNPHIHCLVSEATIDKHNIIKKHSYFHFKKLRIIYMYTLLNNIYKYITNNGSFIDKNITYKLKEEIINNYKDGLYVYGPENNKMNAKEVTRYISRYSSRPAISEERIINVDYNNDLITWYYDPHEDDDFELEDDKIGRQEITEPIFEFIKKLIIHIPDKGFNLIRYYGFYANRTNKSFGEEKRLYRKSYISLMKSKLYWIRLLFNTYNYNPLLCVCGTTMVINYNLSYLKRRGDPTCIRDLS